MARNLTEKQQKFAEEYVKNGFVGAAAYRIAYGQERNDICASEAYKLLKDPRIQEEINNVELSFGLVGKMAGVDKKAIVEILRKMMYATKPIYDKGQKIDEVPDWSAINNAITTFSKLAGDFTEKKRIIVEDNTDLGDVDLTKLSEEEREAIKEKILKEL